MVKTAYSLMFEKVKSMCLHNNIWYLRFQVPIVHEWDEVFLE